MRPDRDGIAHLELLTGMLHTIQVEDVIPVICCVLVNNPYLVSSLSIPSLYPSFFIFYFLVFLLLICMHACIHEVQLMYRRLGTKAPKNSNFASRDKVSISHFLFQAQVFQHAQ